LLYSSFAATMRQHLLRRRLDYGRGTEDTVYTQGQQQDAPAADTDVVESAGVGSSGRNSLSTNTTADADHDSSDPNAGDTPYYNPRGDTYEFAAFAAWYLFLVLCCVVPTYCAYRRRARAARLELERRERRMLTATRGSDWYAEAMAELERRRREDEANDAAAAGVNGVLGGNLVLGNGPSNGNNNNSTDVVLFRGMSAEGRPIAVLAGSGTTATTSSSSDAAAVSGMRATRSSADEPVRLVYLRRESSGTDDGLQDGIRAFTGLNFGTNVNPFTSVAGATWFMAATQQREQIQREERTRILDTVLETTSMRVNDKDLLTAEDAGEVSGASVVTNSIGGPKQGNDENKSQGDGFENDDTSSKVKEEEDMVDEKDDDATHVAKEDSDSEFPFLRLRPPTMSEVTKADPNDPDKVMNRITSKHRGPIVPNSCAICLCPYATDDKVSWSTKGSACPHAFHTSCIKLWLSKKEEALCPCCRQQFVTVEVMMKHLPAEEEER
jgi:hypothetical protein